MFDRALNTPLDKFKRSYFHFYWHRHEFHPRFRGNSADYVQEVFEIRFRTCYVLRTCMFLTPFALKDGAMLGYLKVIS